jgi:hypothetical protein
MKVWSLALVLLLGCASSAADRQDKKTMEPEDQRAVAALKQFERSLEISVDMDLDGYIYEIRMWGPQITDTKLALMMVHIKRLRRFQGLTLSGTAITAEGLKQLGELPNLKWLWIVDTDIMADGLADLKHVPGLERLLLGRSTTIPIASLVHLKDLKNLTSLSIEFGSGDFTDAGLEHIGELTNLTECAPVI